jgi:hypothetical protein
MGKPECSSESTFASANCKTLQTTDSSELAEIVLTTMAYFSLTTRSGPALLSSVAVDHAHCVK